MHQKKMRNARVVRAELLLLLIKYADLCRFRCRCLRFLFISHDADTQLKRRSSIQRLQRY